MLEVISFTELVFCVQCSVFCAWPGEGKIYAEQDGGGGGGGVVSSLEPAIKYSFSARVFSESWIAYSISSRVFKES
jgi:hypothetical protein